VVAVISPWNFANATRELAKIAPALAYCNAVVWKARQKCHSRLSPWR